MSGLFFRLCLDSRYNYTCIITCSFRVRDYDFLHPILRKDREHNVEETRAFSQPTCAYQ